MNQKWGRIWFWLLLPAIAGVLSWLLRRSGQRQPALSTKTSDNLLPAIPAESIDSAIDHDFNPTSSDPPSWVTPILWFMTASAIALALAPRLTALGLVLAGFLFVCMIVLALFNSRLPLRKFMRPDPLSPSPLMSQPARPLSHAHILRLQLLFLLGLMISLLGVIMLRDLPLLVSLLLPNLWLALTLILLSHPQVYSLLPGQMQQGVLTLKRHQQVIGVCCAGLSLTLMSLSAAIFWFGRESLTVVQMGLLPFGWGVVALYGALRCHQRLNVGGTLQTAVIRPLKINWLWAGAGISLLWLLAESNSRLLEWPLLMQVSTNLQFVWLVLGIALLVAGLGGRVMPTVSPDRHHADWLLLTLIVLLAFFMRYWLLGHTSRFLIDEAEFVGAVATLRLQPTTELLKPLSGIAAFPYLFPFGELRSMDVLGRNLLGLRAWSALLGTLTIPALYYLARQLFDHRTALLAALLLATFPPHVQFSRIGISEIAGVLFGVLALGALAKGLRHNQQRDFALSGAMLGLTHYFHEGSRVIFTPLTVIWVIGCLILLVRQGQDIRPRLPRLGIALATLFITAAPIYYTLIGIERPIFARMIANNSAQTGSYWQVFFRDDDWAFHVSNHLLPTFPIYEQLPENKLFQYGDWTLHIRKHVLPPFLAYVNLPDSTLFFGAREPLLLPSIVPFFLLGLTIVLLRLWAPGGLLLLLWILSVTLGNTLLVDSQGSPRFVMVFPALALALALGIRWLVPLVIQRRFGQQLALAALGIAIALGQGWYYFQDYLPAYNLRFREDRPELDGYDAALRSLHLPPDSVIYLISDPEFPVVEVQSMIELHRNDLTAWSVPTVTINPTTLLGLNCWQVHAFFLNPVDVPVIERLKLWFNLDGPFVSPYPDVPQDEQYALYISRPERSQISSLPGSADEKCPMKN